MKKVSVPGRLLLLSSPQSDLCCEHALASATIAPGKRGFRSRRSTLFPCSQTSRRCSLCRAQPQLRSHMKGRGVNPLPGLRWALLSTLRPANASIGCACLEGREKGSVGVCCSLRTSPGTAREFGTSLSSSWHPWHVAQTSSQVEMPQMDVLMDTVVIRLPINRRLYRLLPSSAEDRGDVSYFYIYST